MKITIPCKWQPTRDGADLKSGPLTLAIIGERLPHEFAVNLTFDGGIYGAPEPVGSLKAAKALAISLLQQRRHEAIED